MILDMEGILMGGGRADKGINKNQKNIDLKAHIETYMYIIMCSIFIKCSVYKSYTIKCFNLLVFF